MIGENKYLEKGDINLEGRQHLFDRKYEVHIIYIYIYIYIYILGGTVHVFVPNSQGTDLSGWCMRPYNEYRQFPPNPEWGFRSNAMLFDNRQRQQKNSESRELRAWDSDHVLILKVSHTWTDKNFPHGLTRALCSCILPLIRHKSKYSKIVPCLRYNLPEC